MRTANEKEKASELIEKLLSNVTNFEEAIELVLDDSSLSFKLLKIILNIAQNLKNSGSVAISDLINRKYRDESMTALHMAVLSNNTDDISEELAYLLENGGDVLIPGKDFRGNEYFVRDIKPPNHQSCIPQFFPRIFFVLAVEKKKLFICRKQVFSQFWTNKKFVFFFNC